MLLSIKASFPSHSFQGAHLVLCYALLCLQKRLKTSRLTLPSEPIHETKKSTSTFCFPLYNFPGTEAKSQELSTEDRGARQLRSGSAFPAKREIRSPLEHLGEKVSTSSSSSSLCKQLLSPAPHGSFTCLSSITVITGSGCAGAASQGTE